MVIDQVGQVLRALLHKALDRFLTIIQKVSTFEVPQGVCVPMFPI